MDDVRRAVLTLTASLALVACGVEPAERGTDDPRVPDAAPSVAAPGEPAPARAPRRGSAPAVPATREPQPTRDDSIAAAKEDVSPEWKQRSRGMGGYDDCMRQAEPLQGAARARVEAACARLPEKS